MRLLRRTAASILLQLFFPLLALAAPVINSLTPNTGAVGSAIVIAGSGFGTTSTTTVTFNGTKATITTISSTSITAPVPTGATTGNVVVTVSGAASNGVLFTVTPPPSISSLTPNTGATGSSIAIAGSNFGPTQGNGKVTFNGKTATITSWSASQIVATVPGTATTGNVVVTAAGGVASSGVTFTVTAAPSITSLVPTSGIVGAAVTINGSNFGPTQGNGKVTFNGTTATINTWSATQITTTVPAGATTGNVIVTAAGGVASKGVTFTVIPPPSITTISPTSGVTGTSVTVNGSNFGSTQGTSTVTFNGVAGTVTSWSATKVVATVPAAATTGNVVVTVNTQASNGVKFTVLPHINSVSPTTQPLGKNVTISGTGFGTSQGTSTVTFGGVTAAASAWSTTQITATVPSGAAIGSDPIVVTVSGSASNSVAFTAVAALAVTATASPKANANGWNNTNVTISYTCSGGVTPVQCPASKAVTTEGANQTITATATDANGNTASVSTSVSIDKTAPVVTASATPAPNAKGVVTAPATINFTCSDSLSGIAACPSPVQVTTVGLNESFSGTATDKAGNSANATITVSVQAAPLAITATATPQANANGWNNTAVTISYSCSGGVPPLQCPASQTATAEAANQIFSATVTDAAGQTASASTTLNIDKTAPIISATVSPTPNAQGVVATPATITFTCSDALSGIATCPAPIQVTAVGLNESFSGTATDKAGNSATASVTLSAESAPLSITATAAPPPNANGWNNTAVTISYSCSGGVPPLQCPASQTATAEAANQIFSATVTDAAGQTASASTTLNIDKTAPIISATVSPTPNAQGVVVAPATITFTCSDALSGIATCPAPIQVATVGFNESFSGTATDKAGNSATASVTLSVESSPLTITAAAAPSANANGWNNTAVTISYTCSGGVAPLQCPASQTVSTEGANQVVSATVTDAAGQSASTSTTLNIDKTAPIITATVSPTPNAQGVVVAPATITFTCSDALSGIATCPAPIQVTTLGLNESFSGTATDKAGNSATASVTLSIESSPLSITATAAPLPNAAGWNNSPVTITYTCSGGVAPLQCPAAQTVSTDGVNQISASVTDAAGETASTTTTVKLDQTPPIATPIITPSPNAAGWNNSSVVVSFTCSDSVSGIATCPAAVTLSTEGAGQQVCGTVVDMAGNTAQGCATVNIDETPPLISAAVSPSPNGSGIIFGPSATVSFTCSDALSGIATCPSPITTTTQGLQTISGTAVDKAGNSTSASVQFNLQNFPPLQIVASESPAPNAAGWNNTPVTVSFQCSGGAPPVSCPSPQTVSSDGANQIITGTATDSVGSSASASVTVNLDQTPPLVSITSPTDGSVSPSANVPVSGLTTDGLSGVASVTCNGTPGTVSNGTFSCTVQITQGSLAINVQATDTAGNTASASITTNLQGPKLTISSPAQLALFNAAEITVTGTVDDPSAAVVVNGVPATNNGGSFSASNVILREGNNLITATGTNAGGAAGTASVTVVLDTTPPTITINSPSDKAVVTTPQVYVTGLVNDIVTGTVNAAQVNVTVNGVPASVNNRTFMAEGVLLVPGPNAIAAVATDRAGNVSKSSVTVTLQDVSNQQRILMVSGNDQTAAIGTTLPQPLVVEVVNSIGQAMPNVPVTFTVNKSNGVLAAYPQQGQQLTVQTDVNGQASANLQLGTRVGTGNNQVLVTAPGFVGEIMFCESSTVGPPTQIHEISGGSQIGVINQPLPEALVAGVFDAAGNPISGVPVIFKVQAGGGTLDGNANATVTKTTDADGRVSTLLTLAQEEGVNNNAVSATFQGFSGSPTIFTASGKTPSNPANTRVTGIVLDNANQPIPNATASLQGSNLSALTDATGQFTIPNAPVGSIVLFVDGSTSTRPETFPFLEFPLVTVAGQDNNLGRPIFLPTLDSDNSQIVGGDQDVVLTLKGVPGVAYTVFAHSVTFPDGSKVGRLTLSQVHADKVPMLPPNGTAPTLVGTLQPSRVKFNPPIRVQLPNTDGLAPGQVTELFSFHHDLEQFVTEGTMRVSPDGSVVTTDPGFGLTVSGWHGGGGPPPPPTCVNGCEAENECNTAECVNGTCVQTPANEGDSCSDGASGQCGQGGVCEAGECVFDSTAKDGTPCTPDDKCIENAKCEGGVCKGDPIDTEPKADVSLQAEAVLPSTLKDKLNSLLNSLPIEGSIQINEATVSFKGTEKDCCESDTGVIKNGEKEGSASIKVAIELANVPIVGFSVSKRFSPFSFLDIRADLAIGLVFTTNVEIEGEGGARHNACEDKTCPFGSLSGSVKPELKATIEAIACFDTYTSEHCGGVTITPLGISASIQAGVAYNKQSCDDGVQGFLSIGQVAISMQFGIDVPKKFSIGIEIKPKFLSGITCTYPPGSCTANGTGSD